jgi:flagellin-like protein
MERKKMNYQQKIRKLKKNAKGLSPVVASIILIAVTVAVSVVVAAWMGGMTIGLMGNAEQVSITNVQFTPGSGNTLDQITVLVQNSGSSTITISNNAFINGASATFAAGTTFQILKSSSQSITFTLPTGTLALNVGGSYAVKLLTVKGTQVSYTQTYNP